MAAPSTTGATSLQVLLVDDDPICLAVTGGTLEELGYGVITASNGKEALGTFLNTKNIAVILSDVRMPVMGGVELLKEVRKTSKVPFLLTSGYSDVNLAAEYTNLGASGSLDKPFSASELGAALSEAIRAGANPTANNDEEFARVSVDDFISGKVLQYNIYVRLTRDRYVKVANVGVDLDIDRIRSFKQRGVRYLYLRRCDFREYLQTSISITKKLGKAHTIDVEKRQRFLRHTGSLLVEKALIDDVDSEDVAAAKEFFATSLEVIADQGDLLQMLIILNEHSDHVYAHSVGVSIYSIMIAQMLEWRAMPTVFRVGLAGLLHDIGTKEIDPKILDSSRTALARKERMLYETHPTRSAALLSACPVVPEEVVQAVQQHHEEPTGFGYPRGQKGGELSPLSRLLYVADSFCEFAIKNPDYPKGMTGSQAIERMTQMKSESLDPVFFDALKKAILPKVD